MQYNIHTYSNYYREYIRVITVIIYISNLITNNNNNNK